MKKSATVLIAPCIINAQFQAELPRKSSHWGAAFEELLKSRGVKIILLPCTETGFCGIPRKKHGVDYYQSLEGYPEYCAQLAQDTAEMVLSLIREGQEIVACLGVEHSPSCAVSYMYTHNGMVKRAGIFFEKLFAKLDEGGVNLRKIGINRRHPQKAYIQLRNMLDG